MDRQEQELKRFLEAQTRFSFADVGTAYTAKDFWTWAFSNMEVPVLRGVLIEYLVARHLIAHNDAIVGDTVRSLTTETPGPGDLTKSIERFYRQQPHGDVFDLQLTWGVTLEIKSTASPNSWRIKKTSRWNCIEDKNLKQTVFPAHFYVLAHMADDAVIKDGKLDLGAVVFHVRTGREMDALAGTHESVGFSTFVGEGAGVRSCSFDQLPDVLLALQTQRLADIRAKMLPDWQLEPFKHSQDQVYLPLAVEQDGKVEACWYIEFKYELGGKKGRRVVPLKPIHSCWLPGVIPDWRDWEAAGFCYVAQGEAIVEVGEPTSVTAS
ncbi:hypothetical protein [Pseudomonas fluorescens]|uniref:hypothetical protein n=1 Tax=Pseudomonas fluorescens TaxID=294 RepID=UPI00035C69D7|nr:hypothetical protein [Pseudomonas fluorescens]